LKWIKYECSGYYAPDNYYICQIPKVLNTAQTSTTPSSKTTPKSSQTTRKATQSSSSRPTSQSSQSTNSQNSISTQFPQTSTTSVGIGINLETSTPSEGLSNGAKTGIIITVVIVVSAIIGGAVFAVIKYKNQIPAITSFSNSLYSSKRNLNANA
jgi:hypothetical protein